MHKEITIDKSLYSLSSSITDLVKEAKDENGIMLIQTLDTTSSIITSNKNAECSIEDLKESLNGIFPSKLEYISTDDPKFVSSLSKSTVVGKTHSLIIKNGKILLGNNQDIYYYNYHNQGGKILLTYI